MHLLRTQFSKTMTPQHPATAYQMESYAGLGCNEVRDELESARAATAQVYVA